jgi:hypothetical protein
MERGSEGGVIGHSRKQDRAQEREENLLRGPGLGRTLGSRRMRNYRQAQGLKKDTHNENKSTLEERKRALLLVHCVGESPCFGNAVVDS